MTAAIDPAVSPYRHLSWQDRARCRGQNTDLFYPVGSVSDDGGTTKQLVINARRFCRPCRVRRHCLLYALSLPQVLDHGVWGGTSQNDREEIRRGRLTVEEALADEP